MPEKVSRPTIVSFVTKLAGDPSDRASVYFLTGYVGPSNKEDHLRLYLRADLSDWVDVPDSAVVHHENIPKAVNPLGGNYLWVKTDAVLLRAGADASSQAAFLSGEIQDGCLGPTGIQHCTSSPPQCGNTAWDGCPKS